jgi:hypothetical protein
MLLTLVTLVSGQDYKEDCAEAAVPELQALFSARHQGEFFLVPAIFVLVFVSCVLSYQTLMLKFSEVQAL